MPGLDFGLLDYNPTQQQDEARSYALKIQDLATKRKAGAQYAAGDLKGAAGTFAASGDIPAAEQLNAFGRQRADSADQYIAKGARVFRAIASKFANDPDRRAAALAEAFDEAMPEIIERTGARPESLARFRQSLITNPEAALAKFSGPVTFQTNGNTTLGFQDDQLVGQFTGGSRSTVGNSVVEFPAQISGFGYSGQSQPPNGSISQAATVRGPMGAGGGQDQPLIANADPRAVATVESGNNPNAVSPAGAVGAMQTMPATLAQPGYGVAPAGDNSHAEQGRVGTQLLQALNAHYGNAVLAHIAYNMGPAATDRWMAAGSDFSKLPAETQQYLGRIAVAQATQGRGDGAVAGADASQQQPSQPGGGRVVYQGSPQWRAPTQQEQQQYPGAVQINTQTGQVHYAPTALMPSQLSGDAIRQGAAIYIQNGGKFPGTMRDKASVAAIQNYVARLKPQGMSEGDWARVIQNNMLSTEARKAAGNQAAKGQIGTAINEGTVNRSINILRVLLPKAASVGRFETVNAIEQYIRRQTNDAMAANFKNAVDSISNEYARVMTGATTGAPSSDAARREAAQRILLGYNDRTLSKVLDQMQAEMRGRSDSYKQVLGQLTGGYSGVDVPFDGAGGANLKQKYGLD